MMNFIRFIWITLWMVLLTLLLFLPIVIAAIFSRSGNLSFNIQRLWPFIFSRISFVKIIVKGKEKIRKGESYVIVSNHQSHYDPIAIINALPIQFRWVIKKELLKIPLFGYALYASKHIFVDRSNKELAIASIQKGFKRLSPGVSVLFFAEGTRSPDGEIKEFKKGAFVAAINNSMPILPLTINGSRKVLSKHSLSVEPGKIEVVVNDPIETKSCTIDDLEKVMQKTRDSIISSFNSLYPEIN